MIETFLILVAVHFICDYVFQTDAIATGKNKNLDPAKFGVNWYYWLTSHAATHAAGVYLVTGFFWIAVLEFLSHWVIDWLKCEGKLSLHQDQLVHIGFKLFYIVLIVGGLAT